MRFGERKCGGTLVPSLKEMILSGRIPHAILIHEDDGGGAFALVSAFISYLYCHNRSEDSCGTCPECNKVDKMIHPDVHYVFPYAGRDKVSIDKARTEDYIAAWRAAVLADPYITENALSEAIGVETKQTLIPIGEAQRLLSKLSLSAVEGGYRTVVMYLPEKMNAPAANALLKMIEEPPANTLFLLITHEVEKVLPTIFSRCLFMRLMPLSRSVAAEVHPRSEGDEAFEGLFTGLMDKLIAKDLLGALEASDEIAALASRERQKAFCKYMAGRLRDIFLLQQGLMDLADIPEESAQWYREAAAKAKRNFPRRALPCVDNVSNLIERNVSAKILFTDLTDKLYMII